MARSCSSQGFTLIELLTVIAIIGILASLIIATVTRVRTVTRSTVCAAGLRDIGRAAQLYAQDNNGYLPWKYIGPAGTDLFDHMVPYLGKQDGSNVPHKIECPEFRRARPAGIGNGYGSVLALDANTKSPYDGVGVTQNGRVVANSKGRLKVNLITSPSSAPYIFDTDANSINPNKIEYRHGDKSRINLLRMDGSVVGVSSGEIATAYPVLVQ